MIPTVGRRGTSEVKPARSRNGVSNVEGEFLVPTEDLVANPTGVWSWRPACGPDESAVSGPRLSVLASTIE